MKKILQDLSFDEIQTVVLDLGEKRFRAKQLFEGLTQGKAVREITSLSKDFKEQLIQTYEDKPLSIKEKYTS